MNGASFDHLCRTAWSGLTRRSYLGALAVATGLAAIAFPESPAAKNKDRKWTKLKRNGFGCVDVGGKCRGRDKHCCSGRCQGKKPKKGERETSRCVAHDTGTIENGTRGCQPGDDSYGPGANLCTTSAGEDLAQCWLTTGNAGYCGFGAACIPGGCHKDTDCVSACGASAACLVQPGHCQGTDTVCFGIQGCI